MALTLPLVGDGRSGLLYGSDDVGVGGAAADIAAHIFADVFIVAGMAFLDAGDARDDLPGCAIAALESVLIDKGLLHRMQLAVLGEALDGGDLLALRDERQCQA